MNCPTCGFANSDAAKFCSECGAVAGWDLTAALAGDKTANESTMLVPLGFVVRESDVVSVMSGLGDWARRRKPVFVGSSYFSVLDAMADSEQIWTQLDPHGRWALGIDMLFTARAMIWASFWSRRKRCGTFCAATPFGPTPTAACPRRDCCTR